MSVQYHADQTSTVSILRYVFSTAGYGHSSNTLIVPDLMEIVERSRMYASSVPRMRLVTVSIYYQINPIINVWNCSRLKFTRSADIIRMSSSKITSSIYLKSLSPPSLSLSSLSLPSLSLPSVSLPSLPLLARAV